MGRIHKANFSAKKKENSNNEPTQEEPKTLQKNKPNKKKPRDAL